MHGIYVVRVENEVVTVIQADEEILKRVREVLSNLPRTVDARIVGPVVITSDMTTIIEQVEEGIDSWL
jgi:hypothetical protein